MCTVSDKLKLCTCKNDTDMPKDYWTLYRFVKGKNTITIGDPIMPASIDPEKDKYNENLLLQLLNEGNAFDEPLYPIEKDRLQISFECKDDSRVNYGFIFENNTWKIIDYDFFEWEAKHDEIQEGEIRIIK